MSIFGTLFGKSEANELEANESGREIEIEDLNQLEVIYKLLIRPFLGRGRVNRDREITYIYILNKDKLKGATLSQIVEGINAFKMRNETTNVLKANNPSIKIESFPAKQENIGNDAAAVEKDKPVKNFINILNEFKEFILTLENKTFKGNPVMETSLHDLTYTPYRATTPKRQKRAPNLYQAQASASSLASSGGRRTKRRHHTKRHHTKRAKRSKRSKHTRRRKH